MLLENSFTVPVPVERAWEVLLDIERIAPCMPGATLTSFEGDDFAGTVKVKLGPVSLMFKGKGQFVERDTAAHRVVISASGADSRGGGTAAARVTASLHAVDEATTRVEVATNLDITGKAAQFGRGLIGDVSGKLIGQFADCLAGKLAAPVVTAPAAAAAPASTALSESSATVEPDSDAIDLLAVSGVGVIVRRAAPYAVSVAVGAAVVAGVVWWIRRR